MSWENLQLPLLAAISGAILTILGRDLAITRKRERVKAAELVAARQIIDELTGEHWLLLSKADHALFDTLDSRELLLRTSEALVPGLADLCIVDLRDLDGTIQRVRSRPRSNPTEERLSCEELPEPISQIIQSGQAQILSEIPSSMAELFGQPVTAILVAPMPSQHGSAGAITLALDRPGQRYSNSDLDLAKLFAGRAMLAIDNARLFRKEQLAVQARDQLMAIVSHELKNPLTAILLKTQIALRRETTPKTVEQIQAIQSYAKRIDRIINDLRDLDQLGQGRLAVNRAPENARTLISEPIEMMRPLANTKENEILLDLPAEQRDLHADRARISQVIANIISNSVKFSTEPGKIHVRVSYETDQARLSITDEGPGIAPEALPHVFERHWQDPRTAHLGSGLGLSVAKGIIELHGGEIGIESEVGKGTTVWFTLPYSRSQDIAEASPG